MHICSVYLLSLHLPLIYSEREKTQEGFFRTLGQNQNEMLEGISGVKSTVSTEKAKTALNRISGATPLF